MNSKFIINFYYLFALILTSNNILCSKFLLNEKKTTTKTKMFSISLVKKNSTRLREHSRKFRNNLRRMKLRILDSSFVAKLYIGNPPQKIYGIIDTGSSLLHVSSIYCHRRHQCKVRHFFNHEKSTTFSNSKEKFNQEYGSGKLKSVFGYDTINFNNLIVRNQKIGLIYKTKLKFFDKIGAIIGMAFPNKKNPEGNIFENIVKQNLLIRNVFSYYLNDNKGIITFGHINQDLYQGNLNKHRILDKRRWIVKIDNLLVNGKPLNICEKHGCKGLIDTGSEDLSMPSNIFKKVKEYFSVSENCENYHDLPVITIVMNGINYDLNKEDYVEKTETGKLECDLLISEFNLSKNDHIWIIGETFIKKYYTVFDRDEKTVHFAQRK